jgi:hypothetical protein
MFMRRHSRNQLLKVLLGTGLYLLHRARERTADSISDIGDSIRGRFERPSHLKWILAGVGLGVGVGILLAPVAGRRERENISDKVHDVGGRVRDRFQTEREGATGTKGM